MTSIASSLLCRTALSFVSAAAMAFAANAAPGDTHDKNQYTLFNPVPVGQLRDLNSDRPDLTEGPFTVDAGHLQVEFDFVNFTYDHDTTDGADTYTRAWQIAPVNFRIGLCNRSEFDLILETFNYVRTDDKIAGTKTFQRGFGDVTMRLKVNFWGNDGGDTAFGFIPFVKIPTSQDNLGNNSVEGGVIFPLAVELPAGWDMGMMTEFDFDRDAADANYHTEFINSISVSHDIAGHLSGYLEFFSLVSTEAGSDWVGSVDGGLLYLLTKNVQFDAGVNVGVTPAAPDFQVFTGLTVRF